MDATPAIPEHDFSCLSGTTHAAMSLAGTSKLFTNG
jgi:hypothetical protein